MSPLKSAPNPLRSLIEHRRELDKVVPAVVITAVAVTYVIIPGLVWLALMGWLPGL